MNAKNAWRVVVSFVAVVVMAPGCQTGSPRHATTNHAALESVATAGPAARDFLTARDGTPNDAPESDLVVCSWNIKWLGLSAPDVRDFVTMADAIEECDVVAIQELRGAHAQACVDELLAELANRGRVYAAQISPPTGYDDNPDERKNDYVEQFAFAWDTTRIRLKGQPRLFDEPAINHPVFRQVPYVADFEVTGGHGFDFRVLTVHTVFNKELNAVRADEIEAVRQWMLEPADDGEENLIAIGDFNANPSGQPHHFARIIPDEAEFRVLMYESVRAGETPIRTTIQQTDHPSSQTYFQSPVYDHVLVSFATNDALPANPMTRSGGDMGVVEFDQDPWWKDNGWSWNDIITAVSDHRPIWFRMNYLTSDNDED